MSHSFSEHDVVVFTTPGGPRRTYVVTKLSPDDGDPDPMVRVWPTDPNYDRGGQWVSSSQLRLSDHCPQHCPRCGVDLKAEGYPVGHKTDEGNECDWSWDR